MDTNRDSAHQSQNEDNFANFSLRLEFLNEAEKEKNSGKTRRQCRHDSFHWTITFEIVVCCSRRIWCTISTGYRLGQLFRFFRALQTSRVLHNSILHAKAWTNC